MKIFSPVLKGTTTVSDGTTNLSGSFTGSLQGTAATASLANTASYVVSSQTDTQQNTRLQTLESTTGSYASTSSLATSNSRITTLESTTGSFTLTSSFDAYTASNDSLNTTQNARILSNEQKTGSFASTGSNAFSGSQTITGSLTATGTIVAQTLVVQTITSSVDFVSGSTRFGSTTGNSHQFTGSVLISGSQSITGGHTVSGDSLVNTISYLGGQNTIQSTDKPHLFRINGGGLGISANNEGSGPQPIYMYTAGTVRLAISGSGNVGIGTTNPLARLHTYASNDRAAIRIQNTAANKVWEILPAVNNVSNTGLSIFNVTDATTPLHVMDGGNVGIGTTNPGEVLTINGSLGLQRSGTQIWHLNVDSSNNLNFTRSGIATRTIITSDGNVGIGITNPFTTFHVHSTPDDNYGNQTLFDSRTATINYGGVLSFAGYKTGTAAANVWGQIAGRNEAGNGTENGYLAFITNTGTTYAERMRIVSGGNVGIGITAPVRKLDVSGVIRSNAFDVYYGSTLSGFLLSEVQWTGVASNNLALAAETGNAMTFFTNGTATERMRIASGGNIGIGTTNPTAQLQISSASGGLISINSTTTNSFRGITFQNNAASDSTEYAYIKYNATSGEMRYYANPAAFGGFATFYSNNAEAMRITSDGKLLVGITSASGRITLAYDQSVNNQFFNIVGTQTSYNQEWGFGIPTNSKDLRIYDYTTGLERMRITSGGVVLIGQSTSSLTDNGWNLSGVGGGHTAFQVTNNEAFIFNNRTTGTTYQIDFRTAAVERGSITVGDSSVSFNTTSDYRLKQDLKSFNGISMLDQINVYDFEWKIDNTRSYGVIAHELQEIIPYSVYGEKDGTKFQQVDYSKIVPVLIQSIKELKAEVDTLRSQISQ